ncbi:MAG TPA: hypothetical protein VK941_13500 [Gillisia sp.]|nr:hypothetical protein [Gillisia sp.]
MKNAFLLMFILGIFSNGQSQIIQLEETDVRFSPKLQLISTFNDGVILKINEEHAGEFSRNPILFMKQNFNIEDFVNNLDGEIYNYYVVDFKSRKGNLEARFSNRGELIRTTQNFKNVALPHEISKDLLLDHSGWIMTGNSYTAVGTGDGILREKYKVQLKNEKNSKTIKITPQRVMGVAALR